MSARTFIEEPAHGLRVPFGGGPVKGRLAEAGAAEVDDRLVHREHQAHVLHTTALSAEWYMKRDWAEHETEHEGTAGGGSRRAGGGRRGRGAQRWQQPRRLDGDSSSRRRGESATHHRRIEKLFSLLGGGGTARASGGGRVLLGSAGGRRASAVRARRAGDAATVLIGGLGLLFGGLRRSEGRRRGQVSGG